MNQAPNTQPQTGANDTTFPSQPATNTNPFATDLKGEFTSNFGTNANTVSQIFKDGGFGSENRTKYLMIAGGIVLLLVAAFVLYPVFMEEGTEEFADGEVISETVEGEEVIAGETEEVTEDAALAAEETAETTEIAEETAVNPEEAAPAEMAAPAGDGAVALGAPNSGFSMSYDATQAPLQFSWQAEGPSTIVFSRKADMSNVYRRVSAEGSYAFGHPLPGTWYWRVDSASGSSEVRSFSVGAPARRNISLVEPSAGQAVSGNGGAVRWQGDENVSFYRVEMVPAGSSDWSNPAYRFATGGSEAQLNNVASGDYSVRLGAHSKVSGRWEYTAPQAVSVQ